MESTAKNNFKTNKFTSSISLHNTVVCVEQSVSFSATAADSREVRWVRRDTRLTIRVTVWGRGLCGTKSQRVRRSRCRTQPGLRPAPERTDKFAPLTSFYSITVRVVQFFGRSSCFHGPFVYDSPNLFCGPSDSVRTGLTGVRSEPDPRTHLTSPVLVHANLSRARPTHFLWIFFVLFFSPDSEINACAGRETQIKNVVPLGGII